MSNQLGGRELGISKGWASLGHGLSIIGRCVVCIHGICVCECVKEDVKIRSLGGRRGEQELFWDLVIHVKRE